MSGRDSQPTVFTSNERSYRCFFCEEEFSGVDAVNHFGRSQSAEPACKIKAPGEFALLQALRNAEEQLAGYRAEDGDTQRAMYSMIADHQTALRREEEKGYERGLRDAKQSETEAKRGYVGEAPLSFVVLDEIRERAKQHRKAVELGSTIDEQCELDRDYLLGLIPLQWTDRFAQKSESKLSAPPALEPSTAPCLLPDTRGAVSPDAGGAGSKPRCPTHGVELAFDGDQCWECQREARGL